MKTNKQNKRLQDYRNGLRHEESQWKVRETFRFFLVSQCPSPSPHTTPPFHLSLIPTVISAFKIARVCPWEDPGNQVLLFPLFFDFSRELQLRNHASVT